MSETLVSRIERDARILRARAMGDLLAAIAGRLVRLLTHRGGQ